MVDVGHSKNLRDIRDKGIDGGPLALEASRAAIAGTGLRLCDVDAVFEYSGQRQVLDAQFAVVVNGFGPRCGSVVSTL